MHGTMEEIKAQEQRIKLRMASIKNKIIVMSGKGGVGKTSVSANLSGMLASLGKKTALFDADIHGPNTAKMLGVEDKSIIDIGNGIEPVEISANLKAVSMALTGHDRDKSFVWRGPMKAAVIRQFLADVNWGELDYLIVDTPPGTGDEALSVCQLIPDITGIVVVTTPQDVAVMDAKKTLDFADVMKLRVIGLIENMSGFVCPHCNTEVNILKKGGGEKAAKDAGVMFLGSIPFDTSIATLADDGKLFSVAKSTMPAAESFKKISEKIIDIAENY